MIYRLLVLFAVATICRGQEAKPVLVILEQNPWLMVVGSDSPTFALYEDGTMLYVRQSPTPEEPFHKRVVSDASATRKKLLRFDPSKLQDRYELSAASDQVTTVIWMPEKRIEVYGNWRKARDVDGESDPRWVAIIERERKMWESLPSDIRSALNRVDKERSRAGEAWLPPKLEVMLWPYEYAPDESILWPKEWPGLTAEDTQARGDSFSVFVPSPKLPDLRALVQSRKEKGAVLIEGRKMAIGTRFPFPAEEKWMNYQEEAQPGATDNPGDAQ